MNETNRKLFLAFTAVVFAFNSIHHMLNYNYILVSLCLPSTVRSHRAHTILQKAQEHLLNERMGQNYLITDRMKHRLDNLHQKLCDALLKPVMDTVT